MFFVGLDLHDAPSALNCSWERAQMLAAYRAVVAFKVVEHTTDVPPQADAVWDAEFTGDAGDPYNALCAAQASAYAAGWDTCCIKNTLAAAVVPDVWNADPTFYVTLRVRGRVE